MTENTAEVHEAAERLFAWYRTITPAPETLPLTFERLADVAQQAYLRDAKICVDAKGDVEKAAEGMYNTHPRTIAWGTIPAKNNPKAYYRARARAAMQVAVA